MRLERLNKSQVEEIYKTKMQEDFPADEIKPLKAILQGIDKGIYEPCGLFEDSELIGYAFFVKLGSDYLLDYLAVHSDMRNKGVGSTAVMLIANNLKDADNVIVEVEDPDYAEAASEKDLQTRRYNFYLRNGCTDTGLRVKCFGVPFRILRMGPQQKEDHDKLWKLYQEFYRVMLPKEMFEKNLSLNEYIDIFSRDGSIIKVMPFHEFLEHVKDHNDEEFCRGLEDIEKRL